MRTKCSWKINWRASPSGSASETIPRKTAGASFQACLTDGHSPAHEQAQERAARKSDRAKRCVINFASTTYHSGSPRFSMVAMDAKLLRCRKTRVIAWLSGGVVQGG